MLIADATPGEGGPVPRTNGCRWGRSISSLVRLHSRDHMPQLYRIRAPRATLEAAGFERDEELDMTHRSTAEVAADKTAWRQDAWWRCAETESFLKAPRVEGACGSTLATCSRRIALHLSRWGAVAGSVVPALRLRFDVRDVSVIGVESVGDAPEHGLGARLDVDPPITAANVGLD